MNVGAHGHSLISLEAQIWKPWKYITMRNTKTQQVNWSHLEEYGGTKSPAGQALPVLVSRDRMGS